MAPPKVDSETEASKSDTDSEATKSTESTESEEAKTEEEKAKTKEEEEKAKKEKEEEDAELEKSLFVENHILGAAASIRRQKRYEELTRKMQEEFGGLTGKKNHGKVGEKAMELIDALTGKAPAKSKSSSSSSSTKSKSKSTTSTTTEDADDQPFQLNPIDDALLWFGLVSMAITFGLLYRASRKKKFRCSKAYIEKELKEL